MPSFFYFHVSIFLKYWSNNWPDISTPANTPTTDWPEPTYSITYIPTTSYMYLYILHITCTTIPLLRITCTTYTDLLNWLLSYLMFTTYLLATSWLWYFILLHYFYLLTNPCAPTWHTHTNYFLLPFTSLHYVTLGPFLDHTWTYWPTN